MDGVDDAILGEGSGLGFVDRVVVCGGSEGEDDDENGFEDDEGDEEEAEEGEDGEVEEVGVEEVEDGPEEEVAQVVLAEEGDEAHEI